MTDKPVGQGYLNLLGELTTNAPPCVKNIVSKMIQETDFKAQLEYYEIHNHGMSRDIVLAAIGAAHAKMAADVDQHKVGSTSFDKVITNAVVFAFIAGAALAKEKKI